MSSSLQIPRANSGKPALPANSGDAGRVRVLHLNAGNLYGGVETLLTTMARLRDVCPEMEPHFATCYEGRYSRELEASGSPVYWLGPARFSRPWTVLRARRRLRELLRRERFDLVICHMAWTLAAFSGAAREAGHKVALWAHGFQAKENWLERLARRMTADVAIANSEFTAANVRRHFPKTPVEVIYCPMALAEAPDADEWRAAVRREQNVDDDAAVILQVSRLERWKGHEIHLRALAKLPSSKKWTCWIAGGPQSQPEQHYLSELRDLANQLGIAGRVRFLNQRTDVPKLLAAADVFCQPNQGPEPFGLVFVEALWAGRPVITCALGGATEIIDQTCGLLVEPGDVDGLAEALGGLIESPELRRQLGSAGPGRARQLCDPASQMKKLIRLSRALSSQRIA